MVLVALNSRLLQGSGFSGSLLLFEQLQGKKKKEKEKDVGTIDYFICLSFVYLTCKFKACKVLAKHEVTQMNPHPGLCPRLC